MTQSIRNLIKSLGVSISEAQNDIDQFTLRKYANYFTEEKSEDGRITLIPKSVSLPLPHTDEIIDIPIITLVNHTTLAIEEVEIRISVNASWNPQSEEVEIDVSPIVPTKDSAATDGVNPHNMSQIILKFKTTVVAEGILKHAETHYQEFKRKQY